MSASDTRSEQELLNVAQAAADGAPGALEGFLQLFTPQEALKLLQRLQHSREQVAYLSEHSDIPDRCDMTHQEPYDFGQCEVHDSTFPLGGTCKWDGQDSIAEVLMNEIDELRGRAVKAEHQLWVFQTGRGDNETENS